MDKKKKIAKDYFTDFIYLDVEGKTKEEVFMNIALFAKEKGLTQDEIFLYRKLIDHEKTKGATAAGYGIDLPAAYSQELNCPFAFILCRTKNPIDFNPLDGKSVHIILVSLIKDKTAPKLLKAMARIAGLLRKEDFREAFLKAENNNEVLLLLGDKKWNAKMKK